MSNRYAAIWFNEARTHFKWVWYWILGINAYILLAVSIYPGEEALNSFLGLFESEEYFQAFLGQIGGEDASYRLWISIMLPFVSLAYFIYAVMLGVRISTSAISDDTGELIHPQPLHRFEFLTVRFTVGLAAILGMLLVTALLLMIPLTGEAVPFENVVTMTWWGFLFLTAAMTLGMTLGPLAADTGRGNMFALVASLTLYGWQLLGNILPDLNDTNEYNPLNWFLPGQAVLSNEVGDDVVGYILVMTAIFTLLSNVLFIKRDLIKEAAIPIPLLTAWSRRRKSKNGGRSDRDRLLVMWARPLERRLPFTADFIYSERKALLVAFWGVIMFYPAQLMAFQPNDEQFLATLQETVASFGNSGVMKVFTYGHDLSGNLFLWFIITQAVGNHYFFFVPLSAHWIKKILISDAENLTGEIYGALPVKGHQVMLQRLLAVLLELFFIVAQMIFWLLVSEAAIGTSVNQTWEVVAILSVIPLYIFLITAGLSLGMLVNEGVKYARLTLLALVIWFIAGVLSDGPTGVFGMYDPVLIITEKSLTVSGGGVLWLSALAAVFTAVIFRLAPRFDWLRITTREPSMFENTIVS